MRTLGFGMGAFVVSNVSVEDSLVPPLFVAVTLNVYFVPALSPVTTAKMPRGSCRPESSPGCTPPFCPTASSVRIQRCTISLPSLQG